MTCFKCGTEEGKIIKHHINYNPEIIVDCCWSCHQTIHRRVRRENACLLSVAEVHQLSKKSSGRRNIKRYYTNKKKAAREYYNNFLEYLDFSETIAPTIQLFERIRYNLITGKVNYQSYFHGYRKKLHYIDIENSSDNSILGGNT